MPLTSPPKQKQKSPKIQADACLVESLKRESRWDFHLNVRSPRWEPIVLVNSAEQLFTQLNLGRSDLIGWLKRWKMCPLIPCRTIVEIIHPFLDQIQAHCLSELELK